MQWVKSAGAADGQTARHRRNRRRPTWRRDGDGVCAARIACVVYMGAEEWRGRRQTFSACDCSAPSVSRQCGIAHVEGRHQRGHARLGDECERTHYLLGSALGPHPVSADGARISSRHRPRSAGTDSVRLGKVAARANRLRWRRLKCHRSFSSFHRRRTSQIDRCGSWRTRRFLGEHAARFHTGAKSGGDRVGVLQGTMFLELLQDPNGQIATTHSISAGLDYSAIGPEHAFLRDNRRAEYVRSSDGEALEGFELCARLEGIIPALETAHAIMPAIRIARELLRDDAIVVNLSGRGDKNVQLVADLKSQ